MYGVHVHGIGNGKKIVAHRPFSIQSIVEILSIYFDKLFGVLEVGSAGDLIYVLRTNKQINNEINLCEWNELL